MPVCIRRAGINELPLNTEDFALRVIQKLLEKFDIFCTSLRSVMKLRPEWSCLVKQLKKKNMTDCESWVFHHRFDNLNNLFSWTF